MRSERLFCEQLAYNLLWLWFLDREFDQGSFDHSIHAKNYERVLSPRRPSCSLSRSMNCRGRKAGPATSHFTADGTLIEAWASLKSFVRKDGGDRAKVQAAKDDDPGNPTINFHGEKRSNDDAPEHDRPAKRALRKAAGKAAKLCFGAKC